MPLVHVPDEMIILGGSSSHQQGGLKKDQGDTGRNGELGKGLVTEILDGAYQEEEEEDIEEIEVIETTPPLSGSKGGTVSQGKGVNWTNRMETEDSTLLGVTCGLVPGVTVEKLHGRQVLLHTATQSIPCATKESC